MNIEETIIAVQRKLGVQADGKAGPQTWSAIYGSLFPGKPAPKPLAPTTKPLARSDMVDARSEANIATLLTQVQPYARALVVKAAAAGITIKVISGTRTYEEQNALYAKGRSTPPIGRKYIVTNAPAGYSNHNFGIAFDIGVFEGAEYIPESPKYKAVGAIGMDLGLDWGGNWKSIQDEPHFELRPEWAGNLSEREMLAELRSRTAAGTGIFT
jgi:peptidoglycan L-alanyl-D-glutamate endopeptidase CwlK